MADTVSIILDITDSSLKKRQKAVTNISPTATNNALLRFANAFNALSTDTLEKVTRVDRKELNSTAYSVMGADEIFFEFTGSTVDDWAIYNYILLDETDTLVKATWALAPIGEEIPTNIIRIGSMPGTPNRTGFIALEGITTGSGITAEYTYQITATYNEIAYAKNVRIKFFAKEE